MWCDVMWSQFPSRAQTVWSIFLFSVRELTLLKTVFFWDAHQTVKLAYKSLVTQSITYQSRTFFIGRKWQSNIVFMNINSIILVVVILVGNYDLRQANNSNNKREDTYQYNELNWIKLIVVIVAIVVKILLFIVVAVVSVHTSTNVCFTVLFC